MMFNVQKAQQPVKISHPLVRDAYLRKEAGSRKHETGVLVLEARSNHKDMEFGGFDSYLYDLVSDLQSLKEQAEQQGCPVDRIDICTH